MPQQSQDIALVTTVVTVLTNTTGPLPNGLVGTLYSVTLSASGGAIPYTWSLSTGTLPTGLSLSSAGVISGTPTSSGTFSFQVKVQDASGQSVDQTFIIVVATTLAITSTSPIPDPVIGVAYSFQLTASGGITPYAWALNGGALPPGLTLSPSGLISGTPTAAGAYNWHAKVTDSGV